MHEACIPHNIFIIILIECGIALKKDALACELEQTAKAMQPLYIPLPPVV